MVSDASDGFCACKVGRNASKYGLRSLDDRLQRHHDSGASLRDLEETINKSFLQGALEQQGVELTGGIDSVYRVLTDEGASAGRQAETRHQLERAGIDIDTLLADFVSYQTVRNHLRDCLDIDTAREGEVSIADARRTIEWARSRSVGVIGRTIDRLVSADELEIGDFEVTEIVRVTCTECGSTIGIDDLLESGGCGCRDT